MAKQYSKREFLKIMGLGIIFMPFISCFDQASNTTPENEEDLNKNSPSKEPESNKDAEFNITDADVIILSRNDTNYAKFNQGFNKRIQKFPKYIALCKTDKGVQFAIQKAKNENLKVAVKSGGHSFEAFSSNNDGMVINMSQMKAIKWLNDNEILVQPGCLLQELHNELFPKRKMLPAGSCGTVGIAGLTLGGGYGFFSRKFGLTCDSLLQTTMIDANAKVINSDDDAELLWALKGAGNGNFGVVTSLKFKVYNQPPTFDSYVLKFKNMDLEKFEHTLSTWFTVTKDLPPEAFGAYVLNGSTLTILLTNYSNSNKIGSIITPLTDIADTVSPTLNADLPKAMKRYYGRTGPINFKNASCGLFSSYDDFTNITNELITKVLANKGIILQVNTLGGKIMDPTFEKESAYPHRKLGYLGELQAYWDNDSQANKLINAFEDIQQVFKNNGVTAHYRNYPDINFKNWETAYYGDNYTKLQSIKKRIDPEDVFQYEQSIKA